jgi:beta-glucanase (GH16 family)
LVWSDEFNDFGKPDPEKWGYEHGFIRNLEKQYYTESLKNARVENGSLILETHKETIKNEAFVSQESANWRENWPEATYTSASLTTKGLAQWTYGIIEVRAKLPKGAGLWPAIWMLNENYDEENSKKGEIDIMEHVGFDRNSIIGSVHLNTPENESYQFQSKKIRIKSPYDEFHVYAIRWTAKQIDFLLDGKMYQTIRKKNFNQRDQWPFDQPYYLKLNVAIGGISGGKKGIDDSLFPQKMIIDYVRVYQKE